MVWKRRHEHRDRYCDSHPTDANLLKAQSSKETKKGIDDDSSTGWSVSPSTIPLEAIVPIHNSSVCVISMVRFESLYVISVSRDVSWDNVPIAYWTAIECNIGIVCACLPSLKQLLSRFLPFLIHSGPGSVRDARQESRDAWEHGHSRALNEACDSHALVTQVSGPDFARSVPGLTLPLKALSHTTKRSSGEFSPGNIEQGSIQVTTVIEQDVGDESDNSSHRQLVWK